MGCDGQNLIWCEIEWIPEPLGSFSEIWSSKGRTAKSGVKSSGLDQMVGIPEVGIATHFPRRGHDQKTVSVGNPSQIRQLRTESARCCYEDILQGQYNLPPIACLGSRCAFLWHVSCTMCDRFSGAQRASATNVRAIW